MRALRVLRALLHASVALALQYRIEFAVEGALALLWMAVTLVPLLVVFGNRGAVAGWTFPEMLIVLGWFVALKGVLEGTLSPSLMQVVEHVRKGTLDFVLIKPADAQLLVSFAKIEPWRVVDLVGAGLIFAYAFRRIGHAPTWGQVLLAAVLLCAAVLVLYSIAILVVSIAFIAVRVDNLLYLFQSIFDGARWPSSVFRGCSPRPPAPSGWRRSAGILQPALSASSDQPRSARSARRKLCKKIPCALCAPWLIRSRHLPRKSPGGSSCAHL